MFATLLALLATPAVSSVSAIAQLFNGTALSRGAEGLVTNPASLADGVAEATFSQALWLMDSKFSETSLAGRGLGVSLSYVDFGGVEYQDSVPHDEGGPLIRPYSLLLTAGGGTRRAGAVNVGFSVSYFYQSVLDESYAGLLLNFGALGTALGTRWGLYARSVDLAPVLTKRDYSVPASVAFGVERPLGLFELTANYTHTFGFESRLSLLSAKSNDLFLGAALGLSALKLGVSWDLGREIDPLQFAVSAPVGRFSFSYSVRPTFGGFDPIHIATLKCLLR